MRINDHLTPQWKVQFIHKFEQAPYNKKLGVKVDDVAFGKCRMRLEYAEDNITTADITHGGAIAGLIDCAATAAAWSTIAAPESYRGITINLTLNYIASGRGSLFADAVILKQGKTITYIDCTVEDSNANLVSKSLITYKLSKFTPK